MFDFLRPRTREIERKSASPLIALSLGGAARWSARTASALNRWLAPRFGEGLRLSHDSDAVEALAEARETLWSKLNEAAFLTVNEKRAAAGYSPLEGGDTL